MPKLFGDFKLIAIDIDGTLLTPTNQITHRTRVAVQAAQRIGIIVTLATARRYYNAQAIATELGIDLPLILYDGAQIVSHPSRAILARQMLPATIAREAIAILQRHNIQPIVQPSEELFNLAEEVWTGPGDSDNPEVAIYLSFAKGRIHRLPHNLLCAGEAHPLRVVAFAEEQALQKIVPEIAGLDCSWHLIQRGSYGTAELSIMRTGCSKASGVIALASYYHIPLNQVMAIGDNYNDLEMLQTVGWGVAMGQAPAEVQAAAKAVTATNAEEGVALAIEHYALSTSLAETTHYQNAPSSVSDAQALNQSEIEPLL